MHAQVNLVSVSRAGARGQGLSIALLEGQIRLPSALRVVLMSLNHRAGGGSLAPIALSSHGHLPSALCSPVSKASPSPPTSWLTQAPCPPVPLGGPPWASLTRRLCWKFLEAHVPLSGAGTDERPEQPHTGVLEPPGRSSRPPGQRGLVCFWSPSVPQQGQGSGVGCALKTPEGQDSGSQGLVLGCCVHCQGWPPGPPRRNPQQLQSGPWESGRQDGDPRQGAAVVRGRMLDSV